MNFKLPVAQPLQENQKHRLYRRDGIVYIFMIFDERHQNDADSFDIVTKQLGSLEDVLWRQISCRNPRINLFEYTDRKCEKIRDRLFIDTEFTKVEEYIERNKLNIPTVIRLIFSQETTSKFAAMYIKANLSTKDCD